MTTHTPHTPGPWETCGFENLTVNDSEGNTILACPGSSTGTLVEMKANARLIAAAPAMLEALKGLLTNAPTPKGIKQDYSYILYREAAKKSIAKAEGKGA